MWQTVVNASEAKFSLRVLKAAMEKTITSMAKTTGYTAAIIARMLARGDIKGNGIQWPVRVIKGKLFQELMSSLIERGVEVTEWILKTTEL